MPFLIWMGKSLETPEGARVTGPVTSSDAFSGKESDIAEGERESVVPAGNRPVRSKLHVSPSRSRIPTLLFIPSSSPSAGLGTGKE